MKRKIIVSVIVGWLALCGARAAVLLEFIPGIAPIAVMPGESFAFDVCLLMGPDDTVVGFDYYLIAAGTNYLNGFSIVSRSSDLTFFPELNTNDVEVAESPGNVLASTNARSLGAIAADLSPIADPGQYAIATFVIGVAPDAVPGVFTISTASATWVDGDFEEHSFSLPAEISVEVVPEPSVPVLLAAGAILCVFARRRKFSRAGIKGCSVAG